MRINAALFGFIPESVRKSLMALTPVRRIRKAVMKDLGLPDDILEFVNYPTRFDCRETQQAAQGHRHRGAAARRLCLAAVGLLGAPSRPGPVHRPHAARPGARARSCWSPADRPASARPTALQAGRGRRDRRSPCARDAEKLDETGGEFEAAGLQADRLCRATSPTTRSATDWWRTAAGRARRRRHPGQQRRALDPPRHRELLRPLPRLRAHHAAQLLRRAAPDHGPAAEDGRSGSAATSSTSRPSACSPTRRASRPMSPRRRRWTRCALRGLASSPTAASISRPSTCRWCKTPMIAPTKLYEQVPTLTPEEAADLVVRRHHPQAGAHRHPPGHLRPGAARTGAEGGADHHEHDLPHVPGVRRRQGQGSAGALPEPTADQVAFPADACAASTSDPEPSMTLKAGDPGARFRHGGYRRRTPSRWPTFAAASWCSISIRWTTRRVAPSRPARLRDHNAEIAAKGAAILGVSAQSQESHQRFSAEVQPQLPAAGGHGPEDRQGLPRGRRGPVRYCPRHARHQ